MPLNHRVGRDDRQMLAPAGTPSASQDPQQLVPCAKPSTRACSSRAGQDGELMAQEQVLEHEVLPRASRGQGAGEQQPEEFEHDLSIADRQPVRGFAASQPPQGANGDAGAVGNLAGRGRGHTLGREQPHSLAGDVESGAAADVSDAE